MFGFPVSANIILLLSSGSKTFCFKMSKKHYHIALIRKQNVLLHGVKKHYIIPLARKQNVLFPGVSKNYLIVLVRKQNNLLLGVQKTLSYCSYLEAKHLASWCPKHYNIALARKQNVLLPSV